jgi:arylformamidase
MDLVDISRPVSPATAVWPGDQPVEHTWTAETEEGASVNLSALRMSVHTGTHVDAPYHVQDTGARTEALDLSVFVGPVEIVEILEAPTVRADHVQGITAPRVLFKTEASRLSSDEWPESITPISPDAVSVLQDQNVCLVGTDAPSVDPLDSTELPAHHALIDAGIVNIEGLALDGVDPGSYSLVSLPMNLQNADAAPVRAALGDESLFGEF